MATHKKVDLELPKYCRLIQVNCFQNKKIAGYLHDDWDGEENISYKNGSYCELTALYCLWKHSAADIKGLFHYRRLFYNGEPYSCNKCVVDKKASRIKEYCIQEQQILDYLEKNDVIIEIPYGPCQTTVREDRCRYSYPHDIKKLESVIQMHFPQYYDAFMCVMQSRHISHCNMMIAKANVFDQYCQWLFDVLEKCEAAIDISNYDVEHKRIYGYFAEVLMNVWIKQHKLKEKYVPRLRVIEYSSKRTGLLGWLRRSEYNILQILAEKNVSLPIKDTQIIKKYKEYNGNPGI